MSTARMSIFGLISVLMIAIAMAAAQVAARADGSLIHQKPIVIQLDMGTKDNPLLFVPNHLTFDTGRLYELVFRNVGKVEHEFDSPELMERVFNSKLELKGAHNKVVAVLTGKLDEIQLMPGETAALLFVPVRTTDKPVEFVCGMGGHEEAGMKGTITIL